MATAVEEVSLEERVPAKLDTEAVDAFAEVEGSDKQARDVITKPAPAAPAAPAPAQDMAPKSSDIFMLARQQNFTVATKLLEAYPSLWSARDEDGHSLLHWAALVGNKDFVTLALSRGIPVDACASNLQTPLMWAVLRGHTATARILLEEKADMRIRDSLGATALIISIQHACYQSMLLLMHRGDKRAMVADTDKNGCTPGHWGAYKGDLTALKLLEYFGADLLVLDNQGMQPLHRAVFGSQGQVVEHLMDRKADPMVRNLDGKNCIDIAESQHDLSMQALFKRLLKAKGKNTDSSSNVVMDESSSSTSADKGAKEKKQGEHVEEKRSEHTDEKKSGATQAKVQASPVVPASEQAVTDKKSTQSADVDTKLAALKTENERLKQEKERLAKQLQAQELERQNEKLAKEKEELEKKVQSKTSDGDKKNQSDAPAAHGFGASPSAAPPKLKLHKSLKKHLG